MTNVFSFFRQRWVLSSLLIINFFGTIYGYYWYKGQLAITPPQFLIFVPDSPTASLFFLFVLLAFLKGKNWGLLEAFAAVTLIKYGLWAVAMNIGAGIMGSTLSWQNYMLILSHLGMAIQAVLYGPFYRIKSWHLIVVSVWVIHNEMIDYLYGMYPWVASSLVPYIHHIGYFTFWLSIFSIFTVYMIGVRGDRFTMNIKS
ncbi:DUF1405 domain-containing protein [Alkalihalobacillus sp. LMS39]|uniref:DUF1405 domain-containing protein n=1 Tax=Alkalihalobacillus sp. LMS39 TaxID=2924032 RepID=UPI001FB22A0A|nr:DUF1405 domain-containing protein [Alkalihalobacillus sp. LMS39]UOE92323.1 DUF1405 domain-containing protein [Alkalihalobacillus sp. LMS39]